MYLFLQFNFYSSCWCFNDIHDRELPILMSGYETHFGVRPIIHMASASQPEGHEENKTKGNVHFEKVRAISDRLNTSTVGELPRQIIS